MFPSITLHNVHLLILIIYQTILLDISIKEKNMKHHNIQKLKAVLAALSSEK